MEQLPAFSSCRGSDCDCCTPRRKAVAKDAMVYKCKFLKLGIALCSVSCTFMCSVMLFLPSIAPLSASQHFALRGSTEYQTQSRLSDRRYSSYSCSLSFPDSSSSPQSWLARSCELRGLCFDKNVAESWLSLAPGSIAAVPGISEQPNLTVSLSPASSVWKGSPGTPWTPEVRIQEIPADATWVAGSHIFYSSYNAENPGHFVFEELYGWWLLMHTFGLLGELWRGEATAWRFPAAHEWTCDERLAKGDTLGYERCRMIGRKFTPLLLGQTAVNVDGVSADSFPWNRTHLHQRPVRASPSARSICFDRVVVGLGFNTDHCQDESEHGINLQAKPLCNAGRAGLLREFASSILKHHGKQHPRNWLQHPAARPCSRIQGSWFATTSGVLPKVVFAQQSSANRHFQNQGSIRLKLSALLPEESFVSVNLAKLSVGGQLDLMAEAAVFITTCGGGSVVNVFMPPGSTLILLCNWNTRRDWHIYNFMPERSVRWVDAGMSNSIEVDFAGLWRLVQQALDDFQCAHI